MSVSFDSFFSKFTISLKGSLSHEVEIGADPLGNLQRLSNALEGMTGKMADVEQKLSNVEHQLETAKVEVTKPFAQEQELAEKLERLAELNALLNMDEKGDNALDMGDDEPEDENGEQSAQAQEVCASIRATLAKLYDANTAKAISILYGGSMNAGNAAELLAQPDIDGGLIGGASLKPVDFSKIIAATAQGACE